MRKVQTSLNWLSWLELALVLAVTILPRVLTLGGTFVVNDETLYWTWSNQFTQALLKRDWAATVVGDVYPSVTVMWVQVLGFGLRWLVAWLTGGLGESFYYGLALDRPLDFALLAQRRLPMALVNAALLMVIYWYVRKLWGRWLALVALGLMALDPFLLSDARTMRGDSMMAAFMTLAVLGLFLGWRRPAAGGGPGWRQVLFSGLMAGLALLTKMSALPLLIFGGLALAGTGLRAAWLAGPGTGARLRRLWQSGLLPAAAWLATISLTCLALWPALWVVAGQIWQAMANYAANSADGRPSYFMGYATQTDLLPLFYPVTFFFRSTPLTLLGLGLFAAAALWLAYRRHWAALFSQPGIESGLLVIYSLLYTAVMTVGLLKRSWYLLPVFPAAMILSAWGWTWLARRLWQGWAGRARPESWRPAAAAAVTGLLVIQAVQAAPFHPYYYGYWNPLAVGIFTPTHLELQSWGIDVSLAAQWLNRQPEPERLKIALRPSLREMRPVFNGELISFSGGQPWAEADYIMLREKHLQLNEYDTYLLNYLQRLTPVYTMTLNGVPFGWLYPGPAAGVGLNDLLAGKAALLGYTLPAQPVPVGQPVTLPVYWQNRGLRPGEELFVRLVDGNGFAWAEAPVLPLPGFEAAALADDQIVHAEARLAVPVGTPPGAYILQAGVYSRARQETLGTFRLPAGRDGVAVERPAESPPAGPLPLDTRLDLPLAPGLTLLGYNLADKTLTLSEDNWLSLYWQAQAAPTQDYVVGLQLLDESGQEAAYWLGRPVFSSYPTNQWQASEIVRDPWRLALPAELPVGAYTLQVTLFDAASQAPVGRAALADVNVTKRQQQFAPPEMARVLNADLAGQVSLLGYNLFPEPTDGGGRLQVILYWQALRPLDTAYTVFVQLLGPDGQLVAQHDGIPGEGNLPTTDWTAGEVITDRHAVEFTTLSPGEYRLIAGMYDPATGQRLPVTGGDTAVFLQTLPVQ